MGNADVAALAVLVMTPLVLIARALVRRSRGQRFDASERTTAIGSLAVAAVAIAITRAPSPAILLSAGLAGLGALVIAQEHGSATERSTSGLGVAAMVAGLLGLVTLLVRAVIG